MWGFGIALGFLFFVYLFVRHKSTQKQIAEDLLKTNNSNRVNTDNAEFISRMVDGALLIDKNHKIICSNNEANQFFGTEKSINGRRLEAIIHSVDVLEFIHPLIFHGEKGKAEFSFEAKKNTYKEFEVAGSVFSDDGNEKEMTYLLLFRDITEMKNMEKMRRDFVSNASHELRTPVTLIKGFSESLMESGNEMPEGQRGSFLKKIFNNSMRLQTLVDDLLSISELETNKGSLNLSNNRLCDIISGVEGYIFDKSYVDSSKIVFSLVEEKDSFPMDAVKMSMAIGNLIDNAFKYAGNTDKIEVSTRINDDLSVIICDVKDTGIGIPSDDLPRIFERFYVVNKGRSRDKGGTGLGLSIVKHIIESHSGTVSVKSKIGKGTTFTFTLPLKP